MVIVLKRVSTHKVRFQNLTQCKAGVVVRVAFNSDLLGLNHIEIQM